MADTSAPVGDARPLLAFGPPAAGAIPPRDGPPPFRPVKKPSPSRQGERLTPQFQVLQDALTGQRAQLVDATTASDPELVVVFDLAGTVDQFMRACAQIDGLEFLADLQEDQVDADDDFYYEDSSGDIGDDGVPQSLYMVMSNARAVDELVRLFELWQDDPSTKFDRGLNSLKQVFGLLRSIRRWDTQDRIRETGLLEDWQQHVELIGTSGSARVEIELWYRSDETRRTLAQDAVEQLVAAAGGQTVRSSTIASIQYHAVLADIPYAQIQTVLEQGPEAIELLTAEDVMLVTPAQPMTVSTAGPTEFGVAPSSGEGVGPLPRVGLLDGLPLSAHAALAGRLVIDDPDGRGGSYGVGQHGHGTSMAGLIIHGDLPAAVGSFHEVRDQGVPVQKRVTCTAGAMPEHGGHDATSGEHTDLRGLGSGRVAGCEIVQVRGVPGPTAHSNRFAFQPGDCLPDGGFAGLDDLPLDTRIVRDGIEHGHRLRRLEREVEPWHPTRMRAQRLAVRGQATRSRRDASEHRSKVVRGHRTIEAEAFRADTDPDAVSFATAGVVVVQTLGDAGEGVGLLPDPQLGDAQHAPQRALTHSRARSRGHSQTPEIRAHRPGDYL